MEDIYPYCIKIVQSLSTTAYAEIIQAQELTWHVKNLFLFMNNWIVTDCDISQARTCARKLSMHATHTVNTAYLSTPPSPVL